MIKIEENIWTHRPMSLVVSKPRFPCNWGMPSKHSLEVVNKSWMEEKDELQIWFS